MQVAAVAFIMVRGVLSTFDLCVMISLLWQLAVLLTVRFQVYMRADDTPDNYWFRVLVRE